MALKLLRKWQVTFPLPENKERNKLARCTSNCKKLASGLSLAGEQVWRKHAVCGAMHCMLVDERPPLWQGVWATSNTQILLPSAVHLEERLTVSESVSYLGKQSITQSIGQAGGRQADRNTQFGFFFNDGLGYKQWGALCMPQQPAVEW